MTESIPNQYTGYAAMNKEDGQNLDLTKWSYTPKQFEETDIDIKISCTSICGSCIHTLRATWPGGCRYPCIAGHEIVGTVVKAGSKSGHKVGERVGVGAQSGSCLENCDNCRNNKENYCTGGGMIGTYNSKWKVDGSASQGGYADYIRMQGRFAVNVPEQLSDEEAAPLMCAGITVFSPIVDALGGLDGKGKTVGIVGIGGLGHIALQFAVKSGAETYALSHSDRKVEDAEKLGLQDKEHFIITKDIEATAEKYNCKFDFLLVTANMSDMPLAELYFKLLKPGGTLTLCGLPDEKLNGFHGQALISKGIKFGGSLIGPPSQIASMLQFAVDKNVKPWIQVRPMSEASSGVKDMHANKAHYRIVLKN